MTTDVRTNKDLPVRARRSHASASALAAAGAVLLWCAATASIASGDGTGRSDAQRGRTAASALAEHSGTSPATTSEVADASPWPSPTPLAVVIGGRLRILRDRMARVVASADPTLPLSWAPDGAWLLFWRTGPSGSAVAWTVHPDGSGLRPVGATASSIVAWAGERDLLLVASAAPFATSSTLMTGAPGGPTHVLARVSGDVQALRAVGGEIAVSTARSAPPDGFQSAALELVPLGGGRTRVVASSRQASFGPLQFSPDGRWLLYDVDPSNSSSIAADGVDLRVLDLATGRTVEIGTGLAHPDWFSWSGSGAELAVTLGDSRAAWATDKQVAVCTLGTRTCAAVPHAPGSISFEPDFASGGRLAYVTAEGLGGADGFGAGAPFGAGDSAIDRWTATFRIRVVGAGPVSTIGSLAGASAPEWINGGKGLLFARDGALWYDASTSATPVRVTPVVLTTGFDDYGSFDWSAGYALAP